MLCLGSPLHSLKATCSVRGTVLICIKGSSLNIQFSLLRAISGSRDTACDCGMVQGSGDQFYVNFQTMWDRNWWTNPPSVLPCLLGNFEMCLIQFLSMGLSPIAYSKSAHEWHLWLDSAFSSFISSLIIVLPGIISRVTFLSLHSCISQKQVSGPAFGKCNWYSYQTLTKYQLFSTHCNGPRTV